MRSCKICSTCFSSLRGGLAQNRQLEHFITRSLKPSTHVQACRRVNFSTSAPRHNDSKTQSLSKARGKRRYLRITTLTLAGIAFLLKAYSEFNSTTNGDESLNTTKFTLFNIVSKEQISPTAFVLTIRSSDAQNEENLSTYKAAWEHGLWSVEIKQPQLQIARHYTPLQPLSSVDEETGDLRFLIRKMDTGEMSNYLSKLQVGDKVWLRGPHYGFDISKRLGEADKLVFLAGGTGVSPALQVAHKLLDGSTVGAGNVKPSVHILWANRQSVDSVARDQFTGKSENGDAVDSSLRRQIVDMKNKHGDKFNIDYFVDDEKAIITMREIDTAMGKPLASRSWFWRSDPVRAPADANCRWHSAALLLVSSDEDDAVQGKDAECTCPYTSSADRKGQNILCVSGPDGFIEAYVGPKRWREGKEMQGPVQGLVGSMKKHSKGKLEDWLVLKF